MKPLKHIFIINPISGNKDSEKVIPWIKQYFKSKDDYKIYITKYHKHAIEIAQKYTIRDNVILYSVGGDGTANEILNGINDGVIMALIPNGTGNDFFRSVYKKKYNLKEILIKTIEGNIYDIDYGVVNENRFLNTFSMGFDAYIGKLTTEDRNRRFIPKSLVYVLNVIKALKDLSGFNIEIKYNNTLIKKKAIVLAVMNGQYYGGGFNPTPNAIIDDGLFDVLLINEVSRKKLLTLIQKYAKGRYQEIKEIDHFQFKSFEIKSDKKIVYNCDGEIFEDDYYVVEMMANRLPFKLPKGSVFDDSN